MYTHCIHCCENLGKNEVIEPFPIGEKLAFDSERGRLWVICPHCSRWNLTPLEERWEAVEECERQFRSQRLRAQTTNIGYAKLPDGTGLVRIGKPLRPEFAAWRYGQEFSRRRTRTLLTIGALGVATAGIAIGGLYFGFAIFLPHASMIAYNYYASIKGAPGQFDLKRGPGRSWLVSGRETLILPDDEFGWRLSVRHHFGRAEHRGPGAERLLTSLLARVNRTGGSDDLVQAAVAQVQEHSRGEMLRSIAVDSAELWSTDQRRLEEFDRQEWRNDNDRPKARAGLSVIEPARRLALEMALHEHTEQRAIDGELSELETAWREAEEIAGIADNLLLPRSAEEFMQEHKKPK